MIKDYGFKSNEESIGCTKVTKQESIGKKEKFDHPMKTIIDMGD